MVRRDFAKSMKKTVLVVEDDKALLGAIRSKLETKDIITFGAVSVAQALELMVKEKIDAIWLDHYLLGKENGLDFVAKVKLNNSWKSIPIFLVSNSTTLDKVSSYLALGVNRYYTKSDFKLEQIITDILNYVEE